MSYSFIPNPNDDPRDSQSKLLANFSKLNTDFQINHVALTQTLNSGFHTLVQFPDVQGGDPNLAAPQSSIYTKTVAGASELFFQNGNGVSDVYQLTNLVVGPAGTNYSVLLPWGMRLQMGKTSTSPQVFQTAFQAGFALYTGLATGENATGVRITAVTDTQFTFTATSGNTIYYLFLGSE